MSDEQQVRGQDSVWISDWSDPDRLAARHRAIDDVIARALAAVIAEEDDGAILYHGDLVELAHRGLHDRPLQLRGPAGAVAATLHTRQDRQDRLRRRAERRAALTAQAAGYAATWHAQLEASRPESDASGRAVHDGPEARRRCGLHIAVRDWLWEDGGTRDARRRAGIQDPRHAPTPGALAPDLATAVAQHLERLDDAAAEQRRWILDDPDDVAHGPAHTAQETALRLLERRRQAGRRAVRAATTLPLAAALASSHLALVRGAGVADGPLWQVGPTPNARATTYNYADPASGRWSRTVRAHQPTHPEGLPAAELGAIALDAPTPPPGWSVTSAARAAPHDEERDVMIAWAGDGRPDAGTVRIELTARNAIGPARLSVTIVVPAPTPTHGGLAGWGQGASDLRGRSHTACSVSPRTRPDAGSGPVPAACCCVRMAPPPGVRRRSSDLRGRPHTACSVSPRTRPDAGSGPVPAACCCVRMAPPPGVRRRSSDLRGRSHTACSVSPRTRPDAGSGPVPAAPHSPPGLRYSRKPFRNLSTERAGKNVHDSEPSLSSCVTATLCSLRRPASNTVRKRRR